MSRKRNISQMKESNKIPEKELNIIETHKLWDAKFKAMIVRMLNELGEKVDELRENFNKDIGNKQTKTQIEKNKKRTFFACLLV